MANLIKDNRDYLVKDDDRCRNCNKQTKYTLYSLCIECKNRRTSKMKLTK